jgi:DNA-directed RNA polymerase subunit beta'
VEVTRAKVRRERMGHIELAAPVAHIWYVKGTPSRLGLLLDISPRNLERVLYFASYLVTYVDDERKAEAIAVIEEAHSELVDELRGEAEARVAELSQDTEGKIADLVEGTTGLADQIERQRTSVLEALDADYQAALSAVEALGGGAATEAISFRDEVVVEADEAANEDRVAELTERYQTMRAALLEQTATESEGNQLLSEAEQDQLTSALEDSRGKIEAELKEQIAEAEKERDAALKQLSDLKELQILTETQYRELADLVPSNVFRAGMGAEAVYDYVESRIDLDQLALELRTQMQTDSEVKRKKAVKRLRVVEALRKSGNKPHWMIFTALPVIPPELRPMVQLDGGRFATSDLNDLYRRVINRNNRLKRLLELGAPDIIVRNEKRMLQEAVDALIDNGRRGRVVSGSGKHKLKSLSDMLKGKQGRFRQNLLGKRVDYSGRSVIVVGPNLELDECGLPKRMALELFKPFVMQRLVFHNHAPNIKAAKRLVERVDERVWAVLEEVIGDYVVLLNRAPTLHRLGIQAFRPRLIEGSAIQLHPMVCTAFNADFDGDQMAVHVPLSKKAQAEAKERMLSIRNILSPSNGEPIVSPTQDIVLGCYYMTSERDYETDLASGTVPRGWGKYFSSLEEVQLAYDSDVIDLQAKIFVLTDRDGGEKKLIETTAGRAIFNLALPAEMQRFYNVTLNRGQLRKVVDDCYRHFNDPVATARVVNEIKRVGFRYSTRGGMSIAVDDVIMSDKKDEIIAEAQSAADALDRQYQRGLVTDTERIRELEDIWSDARDTVTDEVKKNLHGQNSVWMMMDSGAKGNINQVSQMAGMRGLVLDPQGQIIDIPVKSNFREGLTVLEYFISTHGARKGLADTAIRTADSGYLTRRLVDVAQDVIVLSEDCGTTQGIWTELGITPDLSPDKLRDLETDIRQRIMGRVLASAVFHPETGELIADAGETIEERLELEDGTVRDMASEIISARVDKLHLRSVMTCDASNGVCAACYGRNLATGLQVGLGEAVGIIAAQSIGEPGTQLTMRTFHTGGVKLASGADITTGLPRVEELFEARRPKGAAVIALKEGVLTIDQSDTGRDLYITSTEQDVWSEKLPSDWTLEEGIADYVIKDKTLLATGPNGEKLFPGIDGNISIEDGVIYVRFEREEREKYAAPLAQQLLVQDGDYVTLGQQLTEGNRDPAELLLTLGQDAVQRYIIDEVKKVYKQQGVNTNEKHMEVICRQMMRKVSIIYPGDTDYLQDERVDRLEFQQINEEILSQGGEPATAMPVLLGLTKASLETTSFLSAASFQETTKVLTEAAINGKVDTLRGLKENVIIGKLIPAGSGYDARFGTSVTLNGADEANLEVSVQARSGVAVAEDDQATDADLRELMEAGLVPGSGGIDFGDESGYSIETPEETEI